MLPAQTYTPEQIAALAWRYRWHLLVPTAIMAVLVAQTRVESGVHSALEVASGGLLGALAALIVFQVFS